MSIKIRSIAFLFMALFAMTRPGEVRAEQSACECTYYTGSGPIGYYDCPSSPACDDNKYACAVEFCEDSEDYVVWEETYCGNSLLQVTCRL